jgi:phosphoribosylformylglycinamidine cyclo-ligase
VLPLLSAQRPGDVILGLPSSGVHSNGFSLVRRICSVYGVDLNAPPPYASPKPRLVEDLLTPTRIYIKALLPALRLCSAATGAPMVKALAHITGGGLPDNVPRGIAEGLVSRIDACAWPMPPVFRWLQSVGGGVEPQEMARTFNCGIGMVVVVGAEDCAEVKAAIEAASGDKVYVLGALQAATGKPGEPLVILDNLLTAFPPAPGRR